MQQLAFLLQLGFFFFFFWTYWVPQQIQGYLNLLEGQCAGMVIYLFVS